MSSQELLEKFNVEVFENNFQYNYTSMTELNTFLQKSINGDVDCCTKNQKCQDILKNIHFRLIDIVDYKKHTSDYQSSLPQILYQTFYLTHQNITKEQSNNDEKNKWTLPMKLDKSDISGTNITHFVSLGKKLELPSEKYDQYCLLIHVGAVKCFEFEKQLNSINISIENICDFCFRYTEINLDALKYLTECMTVITKDQWKKSSKIIYKVIMGLINHYLPSIHDQCILLLIKCLDFEDLDYILNIVMIEVSWSLRTKFYMLTVIASKYGAKKILEKYDILSISMWKCLDEPYLMSPCMDLYKTFIKGLSEDDFSNLVMQPIINYLTNNNINSELTRYNFVTYLLPLLKSKHMGSLLTLYEKIKMYRVHDMKPDLYLQVHVLRMVYNTELENVQEILDLSLNSGDAKIRSVAFTILCSSKLSTDILNLIYNFIVDNINSDCSTLRTEIVSGLKNMLRKCKRLNASILTFLNRLHAFILSNLAPGSNYQRKITSLKIYLVILKYENKDYVSYSCRHLLFTNLLDSEDIRKICSEILVLYFSVVKEDKIYLNNWMKLGISLCHDPLFYKNESGSTIIYTVTTLVYKSELKIDIFNINNSSVSAYILDLAKKQEKRLNDNFVSNVTDGTLYGLLDALNNLSFEKNSPEKNKLNESQIEIMLNLIEDILNLMLDTLSSRMDAEGKSEAPSFAQMDVALSSLRISNQDNVQIPTNQFLLNFIWINIKICCDVASKYAVMLAISDTTNNLCKDTQIKRCADIIADVLIRCRHKGAMEATCKSLGIIIKHWKESLIWCQNMLTDHINCMRPEDEISRRSAGVRYLIHAIVTNNKNTVKDCIKQLYNIAKENMCIGIDTIVDLPQARAQHLLTAIFSNSSISTSILYYFMEDMIMLCIDNLNSPLWTIRNAALQFFSSLQVRLIGQNRLNNDCWLSHLPLEPLLYHFPQLMQRLQSLWSQTNCKLSSQSRLIPFMSLLKGVKIQSWSLLPLAHQQFLESLRCNLWSTGLGLEIYTVRNMAAQAYANTIQVNEISSTLNKISYEIIKCDGGINFPEFKGFNHLHGLMLVYKYLKDAYYMEFNQEFKAFKIAHGHLPPLCKSLYISINCEVIDPLPSNSSIGCIHVKQLMIQNYISQQIASNFSDLKEFYKSADKHTAISFFKCLRDYNTRYENGVHLMSKLTDLLRWEVDKDILKEIILNIEVLLYIRHEDIRLEFELSDARFSEILQTCTLCSEKDFIAMLPVLTWLCPRKVYSTFLPIMLKFIDCDSYDSTDRSSCSKSLYYCKYTKDDDRLWFAVVELLQDEDINVRVEATRFVNHITNKSAYLLNPYMCLRKMFEIEIVSSIINPRVAFTCFWDQLSEIKVRTKFDETINPFFNEQSNIYQEQSNIMKLAFEGLKSLIKSNNNLDYYKEVVSKCLDILKTECEFKHTFIDEDLQILDTYSSVNYQKLYYKREILVLLDFKDYLSMFFPILEFIYFPIKPSQCLRQC
ncbi:tRNA (cytidine(32)-2'-O)-methyltransferase non-catalytic subunit TRM732 [Myzus persicae]|uniref:tRNA (cytidine(32)-2'-O)-methyltransferase non-catalytic subunit TRM732 n=1 Tax=Myzus persicae TaxID=13164 RepID=UPI000B932CF3|nr:tRNA (cytidine(32)-2'-O)-methyltransferase non-catalytic subunit TRM732 [Myzus persicae]XP_022169143.1 tRNA (cytidine(32)-2'-O)-methyltransferase non-catalytic subunit TRM732 [Myzus persicae]XP_022169150.1 tRNA (cytidine(32)-2'-O)-methyltransferase non-catalytic subunit TRM732 [Myzus persicae]